MRSFVKIKPSRNGKITLSFIDIGKSCLTVKGGFMMNPFFLFLNLIDLLFRVVILTMNINIKSVTTIFF